MLLWRSPVWWHRPDSILTKPSSSSWQAWATGNEEAVGEEEERGGEGPPSPALVLLFLPHFSFFTSQECKSLKPPDLRRGNQWRWCRDLNADPPCVSHRQRPHRPPPLSPPFLPPSEGLLVHRCSRTDVVSVRFLFCFFLIVCVKQVRSWTLFYAKLKSKSNKALLRLWAIYYKCLLSKGHWMSHWAGFLCLACLRRASIPPHFQYWPSRPLLSHVSRQCTLRRFITLEIIFSLLSLKDKEGCGCRNRKPELLCVLRKRKMV